MVDTRRGELRARWHTYDPLGCGRRDDSGSSSDFYGDVKAIKRGPKRLAVLVPRRLLPRRDDADPGSATTVWDCENPCGDNAPNRDNSDRALIRHALP